MITVIVIGAVTALAMFAILAKMFAGEPEGTEKLQKGDIIKQLLALSELEGGAAKSTSPVRPGPQPDHLAQPGKPPQLKPMGKTPNLGGSRSSPSGGDAVTCVTGGKAGESHPSEPVKK